MPRSSTGKWVARAGATGGGRTYRGQVPVNWYAALVLIVILGVASIVVSRMDYRSGAVANTTPPTKGTTWFAAVDFDICGNQLPPLASNLLDATTQSFYTLGNGVIVISPKTTKDAGHNAVLGKFVSSYQGLRLTASALHLPSSASSPSSSTSSKGSAGSTSSKGSASAKKARSLSGTTYRSGEKCPSGTKDAGKKAQVQVTYWPNAFSSKQKASTVHGNPATLPFTNDQLITIGFVPAGTKLPKPSGTIVTALLDASTGASSTTTTTAPTSTSTPSSSSSTKTTTPVSGTTPTPSTTTAPKPSTTSTTKAK